ncbi:DUF4145 domain-containing protein [Lacisediminihabitans sp. H27-G8]|uniref:DUF4145 domain-containing protein n=1 Tax=Lacisediminihabitans sp. H27-G8 TaxID=3111909 RepID=UPI0038FC8D33
MTKFAEVRFRDCGWCGTRAVAMNVHWSDFTVADAKGSQHSWAALSCPKCGNVTIVSMAMYLQVSSGSSQIHDQSDIAVLSVLPDGTDVGLTVKHLPDDVRSFFEDAQRVLNAGVPDAAAVQLRKTLEAAAAHKGIIERNLANAVNKLLTEGYITQDFKGLLSHIRKIGNTGAHYTDIRLTSAEVERSLRFTTQVLRNLFEVPGELEELAAEESIAEAVIAATEAVDAVPE